MGAPRIMQQLRRSTRQLHDQIEAVPFHRRLASGELTGHEYLDLLQCLARIHGTQENIRRRDHLRGGPVARYGSDLLRLRAVLAKDIDDARRHLGSSGGEPPAAVDEYCQHLQELYEAKPLAILGHLYVMHGSLLGGLQLRPLFLKTLQWPPEQLRYFGGLGEGLVPAWRGFRQAMEEAQFEAAERQAIVEAANGAFGHLIEIYDSFSDPRLPERTRATGGRR